MNIHCRSCGQGYDAFYLQNEVVFDSPLTKGAAEYWCALPDSEQLSGFYRQQFAIRGWQFGESTLAVMRCPRCADVAKPSVVPSGGQQQTEKDGLLRLAPA
jgi:hypothetical protein